MTKKGNTPALETKEEMLAYIKELEAKLDKRDAEDLSNGEEYQVNQTDYIKVMSLLPYKLNLSTKERGQGQIYRFEKFGQVKKIIYSDLVHILEVNARFLEAGYFYVLNPKVLRIHGLDEIYEKILTKEKILDILSGTDESLSFYSSANEEQQKVVIDLLINKLVKEPESVDLNMVDRLSRLSGVNISERAKNAKELLNPSVETEEQ